MLEYLEFVDDVLDELDSREEVEYIRTMLERGTGADRQLEVFEKTGDLQEGRRIHGRGDAADLAAGHHSHIQLEFRRC